MFIDENTSRRDLEIVAIFDCDFDLDVVEKASDEELRNLIAEWVEAGDECGGC